MSLLTTQRCFVILLLGWFLSSIQFYIDQSICKNDSTAQCIQINSNHGSINEFGLTNSTIYYASKMKNGYGKNIQIESWQIAYEYLLISCCFLFILGITLIGIIQKPQYVGKPIGSHSNNIYFPFIFNPKTRFNNNNDIVEVAIIPKWYQMIDQSNFRFNLV